MAHKAADLPGKGKVPQNDASGTKLSASLTHGPIKVNPKFHQDRSTLGLVIQF